MRLLVAVGLLLCAALIQSLIGESLRLGHGRPDVPLVLVLCWAVLRGSNEGAVAGFLGGALLDSVSYTPFGLNAALLGLAGYCSGLPRANVYRGNFPFFLATTALLTLLYHTLLFLALQALGWSLPPLADTYALAVPAAILNAVLVAPTFLVCRRLLGVFDRRAQLKL